MTDPPSDATRSSRESAPRRATKGVVAGAGGLGLAAGSAYSITAAPAWAWIAMAIVAFLLLAMAAWLLFGPDERPTERLIKIIASIRASGALNRP
jgi:hypothetical protein